MAGAISATFYNSSCWSKGHCNVWNVRWFGGITDSINKDGYQWTRLKQSPCLGQKNWSRGSDALGRMSVLGAVVPREERSRKQLDGDLQRGVRMAYLVVHLREVLMRRDTWPDHYRCPSAFYFSRFQGKRVEWIDLASELGELRRRLYVVGVGQNVSSHSKPSLKTGKEGWKINDQNLDFIVNEIVWREQIVSGWSDMPKNPSYKLTLQMWLKVKSRWLVICIYK